MAILQGDVKLVKSAVMDDVPEGGGAPTANEVIDGASNQIFPDVSEVDRAAGRLSARKVHVWVQSDDTDTYLGGNIIVSEPPNDPNVSVTIFSTGDTFDQRRDIMPRVEAYLSVGTNYPGHLFGNHIQGQAAIAILQKTDELPAIGSSLALTRFVGLPAEFQQYVRITSASAVERTFNDDQGTYTRFEVTLGLSDPLRADFPGFDARRIDYSIQELDDKTKVSNVLVADAARYFGVTPVTEAVQIGDFSIKGASAFTQLVPSAQIETPIGDARTNQLLNAVVAAGDPITRNLTLAFSPSQSLFIGGGIAPRSLSITGGGVTLTDSGGRLLNAGTQVGLVDYENGVVSLTTAVFVGTQTLAVTYQPAQAPVAVSQSQSFEVTISTRSLSYSRTIEPAPVPASLTVSYMVNRRWYVLREDGSGAIRGAESGYGSGTLNFTTGTVLLTLGALPDVGSEIIFQWAEPDAARDADVLTLDNNGRLYWPFNTAGQVSLEAGPTAITPNNLTITWNDGQARSANDDGNGNITGDATGTVNYARGVIRLSPNVLPPPGTVINVAANTAAVSNVNYTLANGSGDFGVTGITPGSINMILNVQFRGRDDQAIWLATFVDFGPPRAMRVRDNGAGVLLMEIGDEPLAVGTVNYAAGTFTLDTNLTLSPQQRVKLAAFDTVKVWNQGGWFFGVASA